MRSGSRLTPKEHESNTGQACGSAQILGRGSDKEKPRIRENGELLQSVLRICAFMGRDHCETPRSDFRRLAPRREQEAFLLRQDVQKSAESFFLCSSVSVTSITQMRLQ
mmetsp:Transcript_13321/g.18434  ORF Transcript_13321/g.18434 Transcript_13321/m.18434 type:complete len:109 (+) Transcript_13321:359-685(+)